MDRSLRSGLGRAAAAASDNATALGYLSGWRLVRWLPERAARRVFDQIADRVYRGDGRSVQRLRANLAKVRPELSDAELDKLTRAGVRSYLRYWCESFRLPAWPIDDVVRRTRVVNEHLLRYAYAERRGVVVALPHMANWDWAGAWACATGMPLTTVAERLKPERLYDEFVEYRSSLGMEILPAGDPATFPVLLGRVRAGGLVCLLADRDLSRTGLKVRLLGETARMPRGPAELARRTGAPLIPATLAYDGPEMVITLHPAVEHRHGDDGLEAMMQDVADAFAQGIEAHPEDWHMMQKVFLADPGPGRG